MKLTVPAATGVTTPAFVTVATDVLLLIHVPAVVGVKEPVLPIQIVGGAVTVGNVFTVEAEVALHPVDVCVKVKLTLPAATGVTTPALVTVATDVLLLTHVPPVVGESVTVLPIQMDDGTVSTGNALMVMLDVVFVHPVEVSV